MSTSTSTPILGRVGSSGRGFERIEFVDYYDSTCELSQSSLAVYQQPGSSAIWLGPVGPHGVQMHLTDDQVRALAARLQRWIDTGSFLFDGEVQDAL